MSEPPMGWSVLIKEALRRHRGGWEIVQVLPAESFEQAVSVAEWAAVNYEPRWTKYRKRRDVFRMDDNTWVVRTIGAIGTDYFTATIARWTGTYPR